MLRECARYEALAKILLYSDDFYNFFKFVEVSTFDIASDAFSTFKVTRSIPFVSSFRFHNYYFHKSRSTFGKKVCVKVPEIFFSANVNNFAYVIRFRQYLVSNWFNDSATIF